MRHGHMGYEAPIDYSTERGYYYSRPDFVIHDLHLSKRDLANLQEAIGVLRTVTRDIGVVDIDLSLLTIQERLGLSMTAAHEQVIYLERSLNQDGMRWIDRVYDAIKQEETITLHYTPFGDTPCTYTISPYYIKEYNNRWYVLGEEHQHDKTFNVALDRVTDITSSLQSYRPSTTTLEEHYQHVYGVTLIKGSTVQDIVLDVDRDLRPYLITKPILPSQQADPARPDGSGLIRLKAVINYELTSLLLGWGPALQVVSPPVLRDAIRAKAAAMVDRYSS